MIKNDVTTNNDKESRMSTLSLTSFLKEMSNKQITIEQAQQEPSLSSLNITTADLDHNGTISQPDELTKLFYLIDNFDHNGRRNSILIGSEQNPTKAGRLIQGLRKVATKQSVNNTQPSSLSLNSFLKEMNSKQIIIVQARKVAALSALNLNLADLDNNGIISQRDEFIALFRLIDDFDFDGHRNSVRLSSQNTPTTPGQLIVALRQLANNHDIDMDSTGQSHSFTDQAIKNAFPADFKSIIKRGSRGNKVVAIQYALGRLGYLKSICDGIFGWGTQKSLEAYQQDNSLTVSGTVDKSILKALDISVSAVDQRPPVMQSNQAPLQYLSHFNHFKLPRILLDIRKRDFSWNHPHVQEAYGEFVENYWEVLKENRIEADCKSLALFFMDQFRKKVADDTHYRLPLPYSRKGSLPTRRWDIATRNKTLGLFSRVAELFFRHHIRVERPGYFVLKKIQKLDPNHSMLYGVNVKYPRVSANQVSRATTIIHPWKSSRDNQGDRHKAEIPLHDLQAGNIIFIDHQGDDRFDHTVNIVKVKRDNDNTLRELTLAVGSYDDVRDSLASTVVTSLSILNQYCEEVVVKFDRNERITHSEVTYSSEPSYIVRPRYSATSTLMEIRTGGMLKVCRWGE